MPNYLHLFERRWVAALYGYPNPDKQTFFGALFTCIGEGGGTVQYVG